MHFFILVFLSLPNFFVASWATPLTTASVQGVLHSGTRMYGRQIAGSFSVDTRMDRNVQFWIRVYTEFKVNQAVIHDAKHIDHIYEIIDLKDMEGKEAARFIKKKKDRWKDVLLSLHRKTGKKLNVETFTNDEKKVHQLFEDIFESNKFLNAAHKKRLRYQMGQRESFLQGAVQSGKYLPLMEEIFKKAGLPVELTRLPFVESSFNLRARSKVGASGVWQFIKSTGRLYLKINDLVDERNDPIRATEAAAKLLRQNYESLNNWSLAVTAYNHGRKGIMRAVRVVGSEEIEDIVVHHRSRSFGFASSNFFTELLAAIEVEKNIQKYFGPVQRDQPDRFFEIELPHYIDVKEIVSFLKYDISELVRLNPALSKQVLESKRMLPKGYKLRLPLEAHADSETAYRFFMAGYTQIPDIFKSNSPLRLPGNYGKKITR